jgi:hypothetical protein
MADAAILAATIGSSAVALAGVGTAAWAAKQERAARGELAKSEHAYARERAHEDRVWTSRRTAYEELLGFAHRNMLAVDRTLPPGEPWGEVPGMLADEVYTTLQARVTLLGTEETLEALKTFNDSVREFFGTANRFRSREEMGQVDAERVDGLRESVKQSLRVLGGCARDDLTKLQPVAAPEVSRRR